MRIPDIYIEQELEAGADLELSGDHLKYIARVLRKRVGDRVRLFNGAGGWHLYEISTMSKQQAQLQHLSFVDALKEPELSLHLVQGISRSQHMDYTLQKSVELGVNEITPLLTEYSNVRLQQGRLENKLRHWKKILVSACEQCGRDRLPRLHTPCTLPDYLSLKEPGHKIILQPDCDNKLSALTIPKQRINLLVGPEGGFSEEEVNIALAADWTAVALGPRLLRTETAALAALTACQVLWGDMK